MWIPGEIYSLIFSRLPVRSVLACKCVCKTWLKLISTSDFVQTHLSFHRQNSTCLIFSGVEHDNTTLIYSIGYDSLASLLLPKIDDDDNNNDYDDVEIEEEEEEEEKESSTVSGIDDYAAPMDFPFQNLGLMVHFFGSCNGCVCLLFHDDYSDREQFFCLWNPATKEYKRISEAPKRYSYSDIELYAFVYDTTSDDYKFIIAVSSEETSEMSSVVHVYTLGSDSWKSFLTPHWFFSSQKSGTLFNGDLYWLASDSIVCLDIRNEKFKKIQPPLKPLQTILVGVLEECLCVLVDGNPAEDEYDSVIEIWAMQVYGDPKSWTKRYTITHEMITNKILCNVSVLRFMWSFKNGVILFTYSSGLVLYDPEHGKAIERSVVNYMPSTENYSESLVLLNSGTYAGGRTANSACTELQILKNRNSVLETRNTELEAHNGQLVACNTELQRKLHEFQVAYQHLEQRVNSQKEAEEGKKVGDEEETSMTKKKGRTREANCQYNTRKASKGVAAMLSSPQENANFEVESLTVQQRAEEEQAELVPLSAGGTLEPYQIKEGSKTHSTSKDSYQKMTVERLRALLKERGLMVKGKKPELIARLRGE